MILIFWTCVGVVGYTYFGYPLLVWVFSRLFPKPPQLGTIEPKVSLVIAAYNEERVIREKIENTLALDYPEGQLEVVIVADGSTDDTVAIAQTYSSSGIRVLHEPGRKGKTSALNRAAKVCTSEILFSDANTLYRPDVIRKLVRSFADPKVGGVSGRKIILKQAERVATEGETAFWEYEAFLKTCESKLGSIVTADGEIFALRRSLFQRIPPDVVHDDMYLTLDIVAKGYRVVYDNDARSGEHASKSLWDEFHLKVRYASAGYQIVSLFRSLLFPPRTFFALEFLSHKLLRWLAPLFLLGILLTSVLIPQPFYRLALAAQLIFYGTAVLGLLLPPKMRIPVFYFPVYFTMGNTAALYGTLKYILVGQSTQWRRAER